MRAGEQIASLSCPSHPPLLTVAALRRGPLGRGGRPLRKRRLAGRVSPSMAVAFIALLLALTGASYAAVKLPARSVGARRSAQTEGGDAGGDQGQCGRRLQGGRQRVDRQRHQGVLARAGTVGCGRCGCAGVEHPHAGAAAGALDRVDVSGGAMSAASPGRPLGSRARGRHRELRRRPGGDRRRREGRRSGGDRHRRQLPGRRRARLDRSTSTTRRHHVVAQLLGLRHLRRRRERRLTAGEDAVAREQARRGPCRRGAGGARGRRLGGGPADPLARADRGGHRAAAARRRSRCRSAAQALDEVIVRGTVRFGAAAAGRARDLAAQAGERHRHPRAAAGRQARPRRGRAVGRRPSRLRHARRDPDAPRPAAGRRRARRVPARARSWPASASRPAPSTAASTRRPQAAVAAFYLAAAGRRSGRPTHSSTSCARAGGRRDGARRPPPGGQRDRAGERTAPPRATSRRPGSTRRPPAGRRSHGGARGADRADPARAAQGAAANATSGSRAPPPGPARPGRRRRRRRRQGGRARAGPGGASGSRSPTATTLPLDAHADRARPRPTPAASLAARGVTRAQADVAASVAAPNSIRVGAGARVVQARDEARTSRATARRRSAELASARRACAPRGARRG